jgi:hypothetical protein
MTAFSKKRVAFGCIPYYSDASVKHEACNRNGFSLKADTDLQLIAQIPGKMFPSHVNMGTCSSPHAEFESSAGLHGHANHFDAFDRISSSPANTCEPERISRSNLPPKRFFRSFWRSITRRLLEVVKSNVQG